MTLTEKLSLAIDHRTNQRYDEARSLFAELYASYPDNAEVNYHYGWLHDNLGEERAAVPFYERAIALGLSPEDERGARLGLGSTYRCLGEYEKAIALLQTGMERFPDAAELPIFLAMAYYNVGRYTEAMHLTLTTIGQNGNDEGIRRYQKAILFYADKLDQVWS